MSIKSYWSQSMCVTQIKTTLSAVICQAELINLSMIYLVLPGIGFLYRGVMRWTSTEKCSDWERHNISKWLPPKNWIASIVPVNHLWTSFLLYLEKWATISGSVSGNVTKRDSIKINHSYGETGLLPSPITEDIKYGINALGTNQ